jgi:hypothetical protein
LRVHHVVPKLHVLEDLREPEHEGAERDRGEEEHGPSVRTREGRRQEDTDQHDDPPPEGQASLHADQSQDVRPIAFTPGLHDLVPDRVELVAELVHFGGTQMRG